MKIIVLAVLFGIVSSKLYELNYSSFIDEPYTYDEMLQIWRGVQSLLGKYAQERNKVKLGKIISGGFWMRFDRRHSVNQKRFIFILFQWDSKEWFQLTPSKLVYQSSQEAIVVEMVNSKGTTWQLWLKPNSASPGYWSVVQGTSTLKDNQVPEIPDLMFLLPF